MKDELRRQAEERLAKEKTEVEFDLSPEETQKTLHELQVHQIELEMQNEELRRAQEQLEALRARYFDLYDLAPVGYMTLSEQGLILEANLTASTLLNTSRTALVRQPISRFILKEDQDIYYLHRKQLFETGKPQSCELRVVKRDTAPIWVRLDATVMHAADGASVCRLIAVDISERKLAESIRNRVERIIQHDLRSPAISSITLAKLLRNDDNITDMQRGLLDQMEKINMQMLNSLNSSLDLQKIETGHYQSEFEALDCMSLSRNVAESLLGMPNNESKRIDFLIDGVSPDLNELCPCLGQSNLLQSSLRNLMQNALESSSKEDVVYVEFISDTECHIKIRNTGVVPADIRDRFFVEYVTSGKTFGTGLGTYSAMKMITAQGGRLEMETSDEKNETVVTIYLPLP